MSLMKCPICDKYLCRDMLNPDKKLYYCWTCDILYSEAELIRGYPDESI